MIKLAGLQATVVAIGGSGVTHGTDPELDDLIVSLCPPDRRALGYIGTANGDDPEKISRVHARFEGCGLALSHLPMSADYTTAASWIARQGIIYVGGGNTRLLLEHWRKSGFDRLLHQAAASETILAGVSAGGVCWFQQALSDSGGNGLWPLDGLGIVTGSCCPHYSSESARQPRYEAAIASGEMKPGIAIDDGAAVVLAPNAPPFAVSARSTAWAYHLAPTTTGAECKALPPFAHL